MELAHQTLKLTRVNLHVVTTGTGVPVVLLHGWPQTWHEWRKVMPLLAGRHRLVVPDLPGLGDSSRPPDGYDKKSIAADLAEMCEQLQLDRFHLVGHDWGGPTAFALACARPASVRTLAILDVTIPGIGPDLSQGGRRWHHAFHMTPDLPEILVQGRERDYLGWFYREFCWQRGAIENTDADEYVRCYSRPGALRAGFEYYRSIPRDQADNRAILESGFRLPMPVLALGGARAEARGRGEEPLESLRAIATNVQGGALPDCGHFIPEEQPALLAERLLGLFAA
ncbi:MAG: alpha/beta hydrolase [Betaproteobacteria bacterium]|nr:alpha/beta hydrolase [Betaproteobacteria bacterium]